MHITSMTTATYIVASLLFILALAGLSRHESAKSGLAYGMVGMAAALVATVALVIDRTHDGNAIAIVLMLLAISVGAVIGLWRAKIVEMTGMPELIAALHSLVGLAAVLIGWNGHLEGSHYSMSSLNNIHEGEVAIGVFIGAVTFTGSIVANLKLSARMKSDPLMLPGKNLLNVGSLGLFAILTVLYVSGDRGSTQDVVLVALTALALGLGCTWSPPSEAATCPSWSRC